MTEHHADYQWLTTDAAVAALNEELAEGQGLYLDTEFMRERTFWPQLALVQLHTGSRIALIDPLSLETQEALADLLSGRMLYMHGCSEDLEVIQCATGVLPAAVGDTQIAAALAGESLQCGYQRLVENLLGVQLDKGATRTDWLKRPLSSEQLRYAVQDVEFLPQVTDILLERLERLGRLAWWREECERLLENASSALEPDRAWRQVKGVGKLPADRLNVLQALAAWREQAARSRDLPRGFVLRDADMLELARRRPGSEGALKALALHPGLMRRHGAQLLDIIEASRDLPCPEPLPGPPEPAQRRLVKRLREEVARLAKGLELEPEVLMRRKWLEALVRDPEQIPAPLAGWRRPLVTEPLLELMV
jgi:ribonuclease D